MRCDIGDPMELRAVFKNRKTGEPFQPDKVVCTVEQPDGEILKPTVKPEEDAEGTYVALITPKLDGKWEYAFDGYDKDGEPAGSAEGEFIVRKRKVPRD
jgi:hypothetical protein